MKPSIKFLKDHNGYHLFIKCVLYIRHNAKEAKELPRIIFNFYLSSVK